MLCPFWVGFFIDFTWRILLQRSQTGQLVLYYFVVQSILI